MEFDLSKAGKRGLLSPKMGAGEKSRKALVNDHEKQLAKKLGGRRQKNSGALPAHKGDIVLSNFLLDSKETVNNSIIVSGRDLVKITHEADGENRVPGLVLTLSNLPDVTPNEWVMIPLSVFVYMVNNKQDEGARSAVYD